MSEMPKKRQPSIHREDEELPETIEDVLNSKKTQKKQINQGHHYTIKISTIPKAMKNEKFHLVPDTIRRQLILDFFESERCFYLNHFKTHIYPPI